MSVNVSLNVSAVALVWLNVPYVVPVAYQFVYVPSSVTALVVALTVAL